MPSDAEHLAKYRDNRAFLDGPPPLSARSPVWAATVAFYAAVHLVELLAAREGRHNAGHVGPNSRDLFLTGHPRHHVILADYNALRAASEVARYYTLHTFAASFPGNRVQTHLIDGCLAAVERHVSTFVPPGQPGHGIVAPPAPPAAAGGS